MAPGAMVTSLFSLAGSRLPITGVSVILGGAMMPIPAEGTDLRGVAGMTFTAPQRTGVYRWAVSASAANGCESGKSSELFLTVR